MQACSCDMCRVMRGELSNKVPFEETLRRANVGLKVHGFNLHLPKDLKPSNVWTVTDVNEGVRMELKKGIPYYGKTKWGVVPKLSSCPANNSGYGPHEMSDDAHNFGQLHDERLQANVCLCKRCGSLYLAVFDMGDDYQ